MPSHKGKPHSILNRLALGRGSRTAILAGLIFTATFGLYSTTVAEFQGYDSETAAITDSLVRTGSFHILKDNPFTPPSLSSARGYYGKAGIVQPVLQVPFYWLGAAMEGALKDNASYRTFFLHLYNPVITALCAVGIFFLVLWTRRSRRWAVATSLLFAIATIAWPYSKIGMEPTLTLMLILVFLAGWQAARTSDYRFWVLTGGLIGLAAATKPYGLLPALGILPLLWPTWKSSDHRKRLQLVLALLAPVILFGLIVLWYDWDRTGSILNTGYTPPQYGWAAPINFLGNFFSPGKGLIWYSPLVVLGALGLKKLWRVNRPLAAALLATLLLGTIPAMSNWWGDETWGPRYIVPVAWTLIVPIAWWATTVSKRRILAIVTAIAIAVQLLGISFGTSQYLQGIVTGEFTGAQIIANRFGVDQQSIPYGQDPLRWIPELSPLLIHAEGLYSKMHRLAGRGDRTIYYRPYEGRAGSLNFNTMAFPDVWWIDPSHRMTDKPQSYIYETPPKFLALLFFALFVAAGYGIKRELDQV